MRIIALPMYGIGDVLLSTPALRNIKERLGAHITYLHMFKSTSDVLSNNPDIDENILYPFLEKGRFEGARFLLGLRGRFDASINFYPSNRRDYNLAAWLVGARLRLGHRYKVRDIRELNFLKNRTEIEDDSLHNVEENLRLLKFIGIKDPARYPLQMHLMEDELQRAGAWLIEKGNTGRIVGLHPGSSVFKAHDKKRWPALEFAGLIRELYEHDKELTFLIFGGPEEHALKQEVRGLSGLKTGIHVVDAGGIRDAASLVKYCKVFIANDSGLMHLSCALQVPTVGIFGPTDPRWLSPWMCKSSVVTVNKPCGPCFRYSPVPQQCLRGVDFACVRDIPISAVLEAVRGLLDIR